MPPVVPRLLSVTYGARTLGGSTDIDIDGPVRIVQGPDTVQVSCAIIAIAASSAAAATLWDDLYEDLSAPHKALTVTMDGSVLLSLDPGVNSGFNGRPSISKGGTPVLDSRLSRRYEWSVTYDMPATLYAADGRRTSTPSVSHSPSRLRTVTVSGEYRALGADDAYEQYIDAIDAYVVTVLARYGLTTSTAEIVAEQATSDDRDKIVQISQTWAEIGHPQAVGRTRQAPIHRAQLSVTYTQESGGYSPGGPDVRRPREYRAQYSASVDREVTADLIGVYRAQSRPVILDAIRRSFGEASVRQESITLDPTQRTISVSIVGVAYPGDVDMYSRTDTLSVDEGMVVMPVWIETEDRDTAYVYAGPRVVQMTIAESWRAAPTATIETAPAPSAPGKLWVPLSMSRPEVTRLDGDVARAEVSLTRTWRRVTEYVPPMDRATYRAITAQDLDPGSATR
jgi:hypothetical protein